MGTIRLKNMSFYGYHGIDESEKFFGGKFEVDLEMIFNLEAAIKSDNLKDTISYVDVYKKIKQIVTGEKFNLIEALAGKILSELFNNFNIDKALIRVRKPGAPVQGVLDTIEVELFGKREDFE